MQKYFQKKSKDQKQKRLLAVISGSLNRLIIFDWFIDFHIDTNLWIQAKVKLSLGHEITTKNATIFSNILFNHTFFRSAIVMETSAQYTCQGP